MIIVNFFKSNYILGYNDWKNFYKTRYNRLDNRCHTLAREKCYEELTDEKYDAENYWNRLTKSAHLYYNSVKCAVDVLSSNYITISLHLLLLAFVILV